MVIKSRTIFPKPLDMNDIELIKQSGIFKAKLIQIDYLSDSMEITRLYFQICYRKKSDRFTVWSAFNNSFGQYKAKAIIRAINGSTSLSKDYHEGLFNDAGDMFNARDPLGRTCKLRIDYRQGSIFDASTYELFVVVPDVEKGDYYV